MLFVYQILSYFILSVTKNLNWCCNPDIKVQGLTWGPPGSCWPQMGSMLAPWTLLSGKVWRHLGSRKMSGYQRVLHHVWYPLTLRASSKLSHLMNHDECVRRKQASQGCGYCRLRGNFSHRLDMFFLCANTICRVRVTELNYPHSLELFHCY